MTLRRLVAACALLATALVTTSPASPAGAQTARDPVVIVTGFTTGPLIEPAYQPLASRLRADGYTVEILSYPDYGTGDIHSQAVRLRDRVAALRARTGAAKVDLVAHSMGGLVSRDYIKTLGGDQYVDSLVMLGTPNYGTGVANVATFLGLGNCLGITACRQMAIGSDYLSALNAGDDTIGDVTYVSIVTTIDELVIPFTSAYLANDGNIQNVNVQAQCPLRWPGHLGLIFDGAVYDGIRDVLRDRPVDMNCWAL